MKLLARLSGIWKREEPKSVFAVVDDCLGGGVMSLWSTRGLAEKERAQLVQLYRTMSTNPKAGQSFKVEEVVLDTKTGVPIWEFS